MRRFPWVTAGLAVAGWAVALAPRAAELLQYERAAVDSGAYWRLLTGQLTHWTPRMATIDLVMLLITGAWLEIRSRRLFLWTLCTTGLLVGLTVHLWAPALATYRGSSGIASGLYLAVACFLITDRGPRWLRLSALAALVGFGAKTVWELATGGAFFAGPLPPGISAAPAVHLAGAVAAVLCVTVYRRIGSSLEVTERTQPLFFLFGQLDDAAGPDR